MSNVELTPKDYRVVFRAANVPELEGLSRPLDVGPEEILVETKASLVSIGTELVTLTGTHIGFRGPSKFMSFPQYPGYSLSGTVLRAGAMVAGFRYGDNVYCNAGHQSFALLHIARDPIVKIPTGVGFEEASFAHLGAISQHGVSRARLVGGESVAVIGQGLVGNLALQLSKIAGAGKTIGIDHHDWRLDIARKCGADVTINSKKETLDQVRALTNNVGAAVVIESTGDPSAVETACSICSDGGKVILLGGTRSAVPFDFYSVIHRRDISVIGAHSSHIGLDPENREGNMQSYLEYAMALISSKKLDVQSLISQRIPFEGITDFYKKLILDHSGYLGVVFEWNPGSTRAHEEQIVTVPKYEDVAQTSSESKIGFAIVGCGTVAYIHAEAIRHSKFGELIAVADIDEAKARKLGQHYNVQWFTDISKLLENPKVAIVNVCTPPGSHAEIAQTVAASRKHVLVEKPIEVTLEKADKMIEACEKIGVKLGVVLQYRFRESTRLLDAALTENQFGDLFLGSFQDRSSRTSDYFSGGAWRNQVLVQFIGEGIHGIDLLQHFLGPAEAVSAFSTNRMQQEGLSQDTVVANVHFRKGGVGTLEFTTSVYQSFPSRLELHGTKGSALVEGRDIKSWRFVKTFVGKGFKPKESLASRAWAKGVKEINRVLHTHFGETKKAQASLFADHTELIDNFAESVMKNKQPMIDGREARKSLAIVLACEESIRTGKLTNLQ
jgi:UDP-N-acetyl-2-amino-2-deoxyglucuronate dehydrogenase